MVTAGSEKISRNATTSDIHTNTGIRSMVMPGARIVKTVAMKLADDAIDAMPSKLQTDRPEVHPDDLGELRRQRRVADPRPVGGAADDERAVDHDAR